MAANFQDTLKDWLDRFEQFAVDVIYDRRQGSAEAVFAFFLGGLSWVFGGIVKSRLFLFRQRILHDQHLGCLVIVVGNLTVGGTGKTPVVERFARNLTERGRKVAILSRGYKSKKEPFYRKWFRLLTHREADPPKIVSDGTTVLMDARSAGDEPYMLARNLPGVVVLVDKDRVKAGHYAIDRFGVDTIILDDGFQYLRLKNHLHLLMVDKSNPFGNQRLLPRGILREPVESIRRASYVFLTKSDGEPDPELEALIRQYKPDTEVIECTHAPQFLHPVNRDHTQRDGQLDLTAMQGKRVAAFSGIAMPESFEKYLETLGAVLVYKKRFLDHHWFHGDELDRFFRRAREHDAEMVITTEKDAVRISRNVNATLPFYYLRVEIRILSGAPDFDEAVSRICFPKKEMRATRAPFKDSV